jgi:hypothetical protein
MSTFDLAVAVQDWDREYAAGLPSGTQPIPRPYSERLHIQIQVAHLRYQPFQNDAVQAYRSKLQAWLAQIPDEFQKYAFLLATRVVFITARQFEALQRQLFSRGVRRVLLDSAIARHGLPPLSYNEASRYLDEEMDATMFVGNSHSSALSTFAHVNDPYFHDRGRRHLLGPDIGFWIYPRKRLGEPTPSASVTQAALRFETEVLATDKHLQGKSRLVVLEDFAGTGEDLHKNLQLLTQSTLPIREVVLAPIIITEYARVRLTEECHHASSATRKYSLQCAYELPEKFRCFDSPYAPCPSPAISFLDGEDPVPDLSAQIRRLADHVHPTHFEPHGFLAKHSHGFGGLALAFAFHSNSPDNSLPLLWSNAGGWYPLFRRASNYL